MYYLIFITSSVNLHNFIHKKLGFQGNKFKKGFKVNKYKERKMQQLSELIVFFTNFFGHRKTSVKNSWNNNVTQSRDKRIGQIKID